MNSIGKVLSPVDYIVLACVAAAWAVGIHWIWQWHLLERLLGTTLPPTRTHQRWRPLRGFVYQAFTKDVRASNHFGTTISKR